MTFTLVMLIVLVLVVAYLRLAELDQEERNRMREAAKRELEAAYHSELAAKYAASMTEADREWFNRLPDWDRIPLRENGEKR